jgi:hypothetical protein
MTWSKYASKCWLASKYLFHVVALTIVKEWILFKIQGLTLNKSCTLVGVQQTLFKDPSLKLSLSLSNNGPKLESAAIFPSEIILSLKLQWQ